MGAQKTRWSEEEEQALKLAVQKHGTGKWRAIQKDEKLGPLLSNRSNVDLKDKWRNILTSMNTGFDSKRNVPANPKRKRDKAEASTPHAASHEGVGKPDGDSAAVAVEGNAADGTAGTATDAPAADARGKRIDKGEMQANDNDERVEEMSESDYMMTSKLINDTLTGSGSKGATTMELAKVLRNDGATNSTADPKATVQSFKGRVGLVLEEMMKTKLVVYQRKRYVLVEFAMDSKKVSGDGSGSRAPKPVLSPQEKASKLRLSAQTARTAADNALRLAEEAAQLANKKTTEANRLEKEAEEAEEAIAASVPVDEAVGAEEADADKGVARPPKKR